MNVFSPYIWGMFENICNVSFILEAPKLHGLILQFLMDIFCFFVLFQLISWVLWMGLTVVPVIPTSSRFSWFAGGSCMGGCARSCWRSHSVILWAGGLLAQQQAGKRCAEEESALCSPQIREVMLMGKRRTSPANNWRSGVICSSNVFLACYYLWIGVGGIWSGRTSVNNWSQSLCWSKHFFGLTAMSWSFPLQFNI